MEPKIEKVYFLNFDIEVAQPLINIAHVPLLNILELVDVPVDFSVEEG